MAERKGIEEIRAVKDRHEGDLLKKRNVVGLGIGYKEVEGQETEQLSLIDLKVYQVRFCTAISNVM